jgi:hypothetical protein
MAERQASEREQVFRWPLRQIVLWLLATAALVVGIWAQFAPQSFYTSFVFGRGWVAADGPYNEHLIRDVGGLNLALAVVTIAAARSLRPDLVRLAALSTLVFAVPHLTYHASHLAVYGPVDVVGNLVALGLQVAVSLWLALSPGPDTARQRAGQRAAAASSAALPRR